MKNFNKNEKTPCSNESDQGNSRSSYKKNYITEPSYTEALPFFRKSGSRAVLIIHGYLGSPYDVRYLAESLYSRGYTVYVPRLPGHGTCREDFITTGKSEWLDEVYKSYMELKNISKEVIVAGFSMGGLLAVHAAYKFSAEKLILIAPALTNRRKLLLYSTPLLKYFRKTLEKNCRIKTNNEFEEYLKQEYWSKDWIKASSDILMLQIKAKKYLKTIKSEVLLIISESDNTVPAEVSQIAGKRLEKIRFTENRLINSGHMIFHSEERDKAVSAVLNWLEKN